MKKNMFFRLEAMTIGLEFAETAVIMIAGKSKESKIVETSELEYLISSSIRSIRESISIGMDGIMEENELKKMEELVSTVENMDALLAAGRTEILLPRVLQLREAVDYAENRLNEGKPEWFAPCIIGEAVIAATVAKAGRADRSVTTPLKQLQEKGRTMILDEIAKSLVRSDLPIPWNAVKRFLDGDTTALKEIASLPRERFENKKGEAKIEFKNGFLEIADRIREICIKYVDVGSLYLEDGLPPKKLLNARQYFNIPGDEPVILLCDATVFGSCKIGFAICEKGLYWGVDWTTETKRTFLSWNDFSERQLELVKFEINLESGDKIGLAALGSDEQRNRVFEMLNEIKLMLLDTLPYTV